MGKAASKRKKKETEPERTWCPWCWSRAQRRQEFSSIEHPSTQSRVRHESNPEADEKPSQSKGTILSRKKTGAVFVAVIDFGTTKTRSCFSHKTTPNTPLANEIEGANEPSDKFSTVVLFRPDKTFHSFGADAVDQYLYLAKENKHHEWYYFERFKMKLHARQEPLTKNTEIDDILGKKMLAMDVFVATISFFRNKMHQEANEKMPQLFDENVDTNIHWVLTVPAIWDDLSKQFMREAAEIAGIPRDMLTLALEPEAASLVCRKYLNMNKSDTWRYMLLDLGGGTADITCHELNSKGTLKEIHPPTGGAFGGTTVDNDFLTVLCRIFGSDVIQALKKSHTRMFLNLMTAFEMKKSKFNGIGKLSIKLPAVLFELYLSYVGEPVVKVIRQSTLAENVKFTGDHMILSETLAKDIFNTAVLNIKNATSELLEKVERVDYIFCVGGFSESPYVKRVMEEHFGDLVIFPDVQSMAVLEGALMYGHEPGAISSRICKYTYGIARMVKFDHRIHPEKKKVRMGKFTFCDDVFCKHIELGTEVSVFEPEKAIMHEYFPSTEDQKQAVLEVYRSTEKDPMFTDDKSCTLVGLIKVDLDTKGDVWAKLKVKLVFGGTELVVEVIDDKKGTFTTGSVDFWV